MNLHRTVHPILAALLAAAPCATTAWAGPKGVGIDLEGMDRSVAPGDDFFKHANGAWLRTTEIPPDAAAYGAGVIVSDRTDERTAQLIQETAKAGAAPGSDARKIGDYYASYMDAGGHRGQGPGAAPADARPHRAQSTGARPSPASWAARCAPTWTRSTPRTSTRTTSSASGSRRTSTDTTRYVPFLLQGGLDMPDRAYYVDASPRMARAAQAVPGAHGGRLEARARCRTRTRARRASSSWSAASPRRTWPARGVRGREEGQQPLDARGVRRRARPASTGRASSTRRASARSASSSSGSRGAVTGIAALVASQPLDTWKDYLRVPRHRALRRRAAEGVRRRALRVPRHRRSRARPSAATRWKRAVDATNDALGEAVGRLYVERYFPPAAKARVEAMVTTSSAAFGRRIDALDWMAPATKAKAKAKLAVLKVGVGYPDKWRDYCALEIVRGDAFGNARARGAVRVPRRSSRKLGQPVDRGEWVMTPQTVNAVNLPVHERHELPGRHPAAALLRSRRGRWPWTTAPSAPSSATRSATASTTRARSSTPQGRLQNWWTHAGPRALRGVRGQAGQAVRRLQAVPRPGRQRQADALSENIADVAGLAAAYDAYRAVAGRPAGAGGGRPHRRPAVLPQLRPELARQGARAGAAPAGRDRRPRARTSTAPTPCATSTPGTPRST